MVEFSNPPLIRFTIVFDFNDISPVSIGKLNEIEQVLKSDYPKTPKLQLFNTTKLDAPVNFGPLVYQNEENTKEINLSGNSIAFTYYSYSSWSEITNDTKI